MSTKALELEDKTLLFIEGSTTDYVELQADVFLGAATPVDVVAHVSGQAPDAVIASGYDIGSPLVSS